MKVIGIIQARMGSTRLPGKVLKDLAGEPMLVRVVNRTMRANSLGNTVVATTSSQGDDVIVNLCKDRGWCVYRGSEEDVLDRYYQAALTYDADIVVRITSDCPLIDPEVINTVVGQMFQYPGSDYVSNTLIRTFPRGLDVEVIGLSALERAWREDQDMSSREHVTPYIYRHRRLFDLCNVVSDVDCHDMRWTVDTEEDLILIRKIYDYFKADTFHWKEVVALLRARAKWLQINKGIKQVEP